jgi:hypothetical protein
MKESIAEMTGGRLKNDEYHSRLCNEKGPKIAYNVKVRAVMPLLDRGYHQF